MAFTFLQLQDRVKSFIKIEGTDSTTLAKELINIALYEVARAQLWPELLRPNQNLVLTGAAAGAVVPLNVGTLQIERVRYKTPTKEWSLTERTKPVPPAAITGKPRGYALVRGPTTEPHGIQLDPYDQIDIGAGDTCIADLYIAPALLAADGDVTQSNMWDSLILRKAEQLFLIHQNKIPAAQTILQTMAQVAQQQQS